MTPYFFQESMKSPLPRQLRRLAAFQSVEQIHFLCLVEADHEHTQSAAILAFIFNPNVGQRPVEPVRGTVIHEEQNLLLKVLSRFFSYAPDGPSSTLLRRVIRDWSLSPLVHSLQPTGLLRLSDTQEGKLFASVTGAHQNGHSVLVAFSSLHTCSPGKRTSFLTEFGGTAQFVALNILGSRLRDHCLDALQSLRVSGQSSPSLIVPGDLSKFHTF